MADDLIPDCSNGHDAMATWGDLYEQHGEIRSAAPDLVTSLRKRLVELAARGHCDRTIQGRFTWQGSGALREWLIRNEPGGEPLVKLPSLEDARLEGHVPKVRVPLPAVGPADALDWLFATVVPAWEPAPWSTVATTRSNAQGH